MSPATIQLKTLIRDVETEYSGNRGYFGYDGNSGYLGSYGTKGGLSSGNSGYNGYYGYGGNNDYFGSSYRPYDTEEYALYDVTSAPIVVMAQEDATLAQLAQEIEGRVVSLLSSRGDAETALREWMGQCDALEGEMKRLQGEELRRLGEAAKRREEDRWGNREGHRVGSAWEPQGMTQGVMHGEPQGITVEGTQGVTQGVEKEGNDTPPVLSSETPSEMEETPRGTPQDTPQDTPQGVYRGLLGGDASTAVDPLGEVWGRAPHLPLLRALQGDWRRSLVSCDQRRVLEAIPAGSQVWLLVGAVAVEARAPSRRYYATPMAQESAAAQAWLGEVREKGVVALAVARERWGRGAATSLWECFEVFGRQGDLDEGNKWFCPRCGRHVVARSVTRVDRLPSVLVLQLERFEYAQPLYGGDDGYGDGDGGGDGGHREDDKGYGDGDDGVNGHNSYNINDGHNSHNGYDGYNSDDGHNSHNSDGGMNGVNGNSSMGDVSGYDGVVGPHGGNMNGDADYSSMVDQEGMVNQEGGVGENGGYPELSGNTSVAAGIADHTSDPIDSDPPADNEPAATVHSGYSTNSYHTNSYSYNTNSNNTNSYNTNSYNTNSYNTNNYNTNNINTNNYNNYLTNTYSTNAYSNYSTSYSNNYNYSYSYGGRRKIQTLVEFPVRGLELSPWLKEPRSSLYDLTAVCNHSGSAAGGHYFCYARDENEGATRWFEYNDSGVYAMEETGLVRETAYVLFYQRRGERVESGAVVRELERRHEEYRKTHPLPATDVFSANDSARAAWDVSRDGVYGKVRDLYDVKKDNELVGDGMDLCDVKKDNELDGDGKEDDLYDTKDDLYDTKDHFDDTKMEVCEDNNTSRPIDILFKDQSLTEKILADRRDANDAEATRVRLIPIQDASTQSL